MAKAANSNITRCSSVSESDIADAIGSREDTKSLLLRLAEVSAPSTGAAKVLLVYARMATTACTWLDGDLSVDLAAEGDITVIEACTDLGGGLKERIFPPLRLKTPLAEIARAVNLVSHMISPLSILDATAFHVALSATEDVRRTSHPPPPISIAADSLFIPPVDPVPAPVEGDDLAALPLLPVIDVSRRDPARVDANPALSAPPSLNEVDSGWDE